MARRVAYLGPAGTFSEQAALLHSAEAQLLPFASVEAVAAAVEAGLAEEGVVPIENSIEGSVTSTLDLLIHDSTLVIRRELVLAIDHCLVVKPGIQASDIRTIYSHPQALGQCRRFIERCFPKAQVAAALSTAAAVEEAMASATPSAAIAPQRAAELYGAEILARGIQDQSTNETRFVVLAESDNEPTGADKTSLCFTFASDRPGVLCEVLHEFAVRGINLAKVESRPAKTELGKYFFLVDLEGHRTDAFIAQAIESIRPKTALLKVLGSYPRFTAK
ncbi:MAG: prephenate dehydratase [Chloroflexi bacterium]|nr:prephenate dehydratase [Chloroflexota bacterium]